MDESRTFRPVISLALFVGLIIGGIYLSQHFQIEGLDQLQIQRRATVTTNAAESQTQPTGAVADFGSGFGSTMPFLGSASGPVDGPGAGTPAAFRRESNSPAPSESAKGNVTRGNVRLASWALSGFGPSKLASDHCRTNLVRMIRRFDLIALQQITAAERDLIPRLVDAVNEGGRHYDYVMGPPTGSEPHTEQLAVLFDVDRLQIDRSQTYTVADPQNQMTFDPMVAWFRVAGLSPASAWTFSLVNVRINLSHAAAEVALLPRIFSSVRLDGRGEDDVVMAGLYQADDSYMIPRVLGDQVTAAVRSTPTDIFGRYQTCNILVDRNRTSEYLGRGGAIDFLREYNLNLSEAETVSSHLPVFAEFTAHEGGRM